MDLLRGERERGVRQQPLGTLAGRRDLRAAERDVAGDVAAEEEDVLQHDADVAAQLPEVPLADVDTVDAHVAAAHVVETRQQLDERRLAGAGRADDRDLLAGIHLERDVAQHPLLAFVGEAHLVELDRAGRAAR